MSYPYGITDEVGDAMTRYLITAILVLNQEIAEFRAKMDAAKMS